MSEAVRHLSPGRNDRAIGALVGMAAGDALGAGYEFGPPLPSDTPVLMKGGGPFHWAAGEWTDDTSMAVAIAEAAAAGLDLRGSEAQDRIALRWIGWAGSASDVGTQTRAVFAAATEGGQADAAGLRAAAAALHERTGRSGGNGSLMRTAPVALAYLDDEDALVEAATAISSLTHFDPEAAEACVIWCFGIRHGVLHGNLDGVRLALERLPSDRAQVWAERLDAAEATTPDAFENNGWVVEALQGAWSSITRTLPDADHPRTRDVANHFPRAMATAVRGGRDTDTVAAIAGALLGATAGATAVPVDWFRLLHGWPGLVADDLAHLAMRIVHGGGAPREW